MMKIESTTQALEVAKRYLESCGYSSVGAVRGAAGSSGWLAATDPDDGALAFVRVSLVRDASAGLPVDDASRRARAEAEAVAVSHPASLEGRPTRGCASTRSAWPRSAAAGCLSGTTSTRSGRTRHAPRRRAAALLRGPPSG